MLQHLQPRGGGGDGGGGSGAGAGGGGGGGGGGVVDLQHPARPFDGAEQNRMQDQLRTNLTSDEISTRSGGSAGQVAYVEGWRVIAKAQEIFGFDGWSSRILQLQARRFEVAACSPSRTRPIGPLPARRAERVRGP